MISQFPLILNVKYSLAKQLYATGCSETAATETSTTATTTTTSCSEWSIQRKSDECQRRTSYHKHPKNERSMPRGISSSKKNEAIK